MQTVITEKEIEAFVDNALDKETYLLTALAIEKDQKLKAYYEELQEQKQLLKNWWKFSGI